MKIRWNLIQVYGLFAVLLMLPAVADAQFTFTTNNNAITITGYTGSGGAVTIPDSTNGLPITTIGDQVFYGSSSLTSISIGTNITNIGIQAFTGCYNLTKIQVNSQNVSFASLDGVLFDKIIGNLIAYPGGKSGSYTMPNSVTTIGDYAFNGSYYLPSLTINSAVTNIGPSMFAITALTNFIVAPQNAAYMSLDGVLFDKSQATLIAYPGSKVGNYIIPDTVTTIASGAFSWCNALTNLTVGNSVNSIASWTFEECKNLANINLGNGVASINYLAFYYCSSLTNITIGNSLTNIDSDAFQFCPSMTSITVALGVTNISSKEFYKLTSLNNITIPNSVIAIGDAAFQNCSGLSQITIPNSVTTIGNSAFLSCSLTSVIIPSSVTNIGYNAFSCPMNVDGQNMYYSSVNGALFDKNKTVLDRVPRVTSGIYNVSNTVTSIASHAFFGCNGITQISIPYSVTSIGDNAFLGCISLTNFVSSITNVMIPDDITNIGINVFGACYGISLLTVDPQNQYYSSSEGVLFDKGYTTLLQFPAGKSGVYIVPNTIIKIASGAFYASKSLTSVTIPNSVTNIGDNVFYGCSGLASLALGHGIASIGAYDFYQCTSLISVTIPEGVSCIADAAFANCSGLNNVLLPESLENIGIEAFYDCPLTNIIFGCGLTNIGDAAFYYYSQTQPYSSPLKSVYFEGNAPNTEVTVFSWLNSGPKVYYVPWTTGWSTSFGGHPTTPLVTYFTNDGSITITNYSAPFQTFTVPDMINGLPVTSIGNGTFANSSLSNIYLPQGLFSIGSSAFSFCQNLSAITIPDSVTNIGSRAFAYCANMNSATISYGAIGDYSFYNCGSSGIFRLNFIG